jgi:hypothetical protein
MFKKFFLLSLCFYLSLQAILVTKRKTITRGIPRTRVITQPKTVIKTTNIPVITSTPNVVVTNPPSIVLKPTITLVDDHCKVGGLHKQLCMLKDNVIDDHSLFKEQYNCYKEAKCSYKGGVCKWKQTEQFKSCMKQYSPFM